MNNKHERELAGKVALVTGSSRGIGVRIEDDMLVTPDGVRWMTEALPRKISDIEAFIAKARR